MKKMLFAFPLIALAAVFMYCSKPALQEEVNTVEQSTGIAQDRGFCNLSSIPANAASNFTICGTNTNLVKCAPCIGTPSLGVAQFPNGFINLNLQTPITISITSNAISSLNLVAGNSLPLIIMQPGECRRFHIDDNCIITAL